MSYRSKQRRLDTSSRRLLDQAYNRVNALLLVLHEMTPKEEAEAFRRLKQIGDREKELGNSLATMMARLPKKFAEELGKALHRALEEKKAKVRCALSGPCGSPNTPV
jgi:hypothetical protein